MSEKYRPISFDQVIGQETPAFILRSVVRKGAYQSAYLLSGPSGVGKTTLGRIFAKAVLCEASVDGNPCGTCRSCLLFSKEQNFGYNEIDAASVGGKDDMVKLRDEASFHSVGKKKIILLDECHDITRQGQDALLKQLEQCPDHLIYIFCTTDPDSLKPTLRKRCMQFQASKISPELIAGHLRSICEKEGFTYEDSALTAISWDCQGHMRDSINILEEISFLGDITFENFRKVSYNFDEEVCTAIAGLGTDLDASLKAFKRMSSIVSVKEIYDQVILMLSDVAKLLYGYEDFNPQRKRYLEKIRDIHGSKVFEFLNYLIQRDKHIDRVGLQSDAVLLHYKFCNNDFEPKTKTIIPVNESQNSLPEDLQSSATTNSVAQISKMSMKDKSAFLRKQRNSFKSKIDNEEEIKKVPLDWPLPKEERIGGNSSDEKELSPQEFSHNLVGGRCDVDR